MEKKQLYLILALALIVGGAYASASWAGSFSPISPAWEVKDTIAHVTVNGVDYDDLNRPLKVDTWGLSHVRFDVDEDYRLCGDLDISVTNPAHVIRDLESGKLVAADDSDVFRSYSKIVGDKQYFWDHHLYTFWVTVICDPDVLHNYALSYGELKNLGGKVAGVNVFVLFQAKAWEIGPVSFTESGRTYEKVEGWYGVMTASVVESYAGLVSKPELEKSLGDGAENWDNQPNPASGYDASATETGAVNMYDPQTGQTESDYSSYATSDRYDAIKNVPTEVELSLYGELQAGYSWPWLGSITASAVMFQYRVRVDVLVTAGYELVSGDQPTEPVDPDIIHSGADPIGDFLRAFSGAPSWIFGVLLMVLVIVVVWKVAPLVSLALRAFKRSGE